MLCFSKVFQPSDPVKPGFFLSRPGLQSLVGPGGPRHNENGMLMKGVFLSDLASVQAEHKNKVTGSGPRVPWRS